jgi:hypothetical protein
MRRALTSPAPEGAVRTAGLDAFVVRLLLCEFWQQDDDDDDDDVAEPPQHLVGAARDCEREALRALQNRVLFGSVRHCTHVPGPEARELTFTAGGAF